MDQTLLVTKNWVADGRRLLEQLDQDGFPVTAAGWINSGEDGDWSLYLASPVVDSKGPTEAYRAIQAVLQNWTDPWLSLFDIKVIRAATPVASDLARIGNLVVGAGVTRAQWVRLGNEFFDEAYIYAPISAGQKSSASTPTP